MIVGHSVLNRSAHCIAVWPLRVAVADVARLSRPLPSTFPALTGRIVDQANIIPAETRSTIEPKLADLEAKSGIQLVVATVTSLEGQEIEPYANALFRQLEAWREDQEQRRAAAGRAERAAGAHRGRLWARRHAHRRARRKVIITNAITPRFKAGDFGGGISRGVDDIITVLTTDASEWEQRPSLRLTSSGAPIRRNWVHHGDCRCRHPTAHRFARFPLALLQCRAEYLVAVRAVSGSSGGSFGGGGGGGGFSGGGGSSGGGGASGSW